MTFHDFIQFLSLMFEMICESRILSDFLILLLFTQEINTIWQAFKFAKESSLHGLHID